MAALLNGSAPPIGIIDYYGLKAVSREQLQEALQIGEGDPPPSSKEEAIARLEKVPGVQKAHLAIVCCDSGKTILFVGIQEKGSPVFEFRPAPQGTAKLSADILRDGAALKEALAKAVLKGDVAEDHSKGHALSANPEMRPIQERFIMYAAVSFDELRTVLRTSPDSSHRALAAEVLGYAANKQMAAKILLHGLNDPAPEVRNNCMRALVAIAEFGRRYPRERIRIAPALFVDLLHSLEWSDRNKAAAALRSLTETRDSEILALLDKRARDSLEEMAHWKSATHAFDAFVLLARINGVPESEIKERWNGNPDRRTFSLRRLRSATGN